MAADRPSGRIAVIDYQLSNLFSVERACEAAGLNASLTSRPQEVAAADALILPGVGAFGEAMRRLERLDLVAAIREAVDAGKPLFGICLGLQLLFSESEEFGSHRGLDLVKGVVRRFPASTAAGQRVKVPHVGWNRIRPPESSKWTGTPLESLKGGDFMYFVHSFYAVPENPADTLASSDYGDVTFCSSVAKGPSLFATQFHPEKSGRPRGVAIYQAWARLHGLARKEHR